MDDMKIRNDFANSILAFGFRCLESRVETGEGGQEN